VGIFRLLARSSFACGSPPEKGDIRVCLARVVRGEPLNSFIHVHARHTDNGALRWTGHFRRLLPALVIDWRDRRRRLGLRMGNTFTRGV
jgi:hypothetical protein